jgi:simple sugar transport system permease protein
MAQPEKLVEATSGRTTEQEAPARPVPPVGTPRVTKRVGGSITKALLRPELSSIVGLAVVFTYFAITAGHSGFLSNAGTTSYLEVAAQVGIVAVPVSLLMIGGEFDLSVGAMVGAGGILVSYFIVNDHWPIFAALLIGIVFACFVGFVNGYLVIRTGLPSFIVTLATMYGLQGATLALSQDFSGNTQVDGIVEATRHDALTVLFHSTVFGVNVSIVWYVVLALVGTFVLIRTPFGNWIYATGGDAVAARRSGVPVQRVKILLFMATAAAATAVGVLSSFAVDSAATTNGTDMEFEAIVAAVIGGTLLTGGVGSPIGAALGALIFGMVSQGFYFTNIDNNWFQTFIGAMLLLAVVTNTFIRTRSLRRDISDS